MTSASPSMTRTIKPQPAGQSGHTVGFQTEMPGVILSSGTKRIRRYSGLPQLASVTLPPVSAVALMNRRRSILVVTRQAVDRCLFRLVTSDAKAHRVIHRPLGHRHGRQITVTAGTFDPRLDVRCMVEANVSFFNEAVHALPRNVLPF